MVANDSKRRKEEKSKGQEPDAGAPEEEVAHTMQVVEVVVEEVQDDCHTPSPLVSPFRPRQRHVTVQPATTSERATINNPINMEKPTTTTSEHATATTVEHATAVNNTHQHATTSEHATTNNW